MAAMALALAPVPVPGSRPPACTRVCGLQNPPWGFKLSGRGSTHPLQMEKEATLVSCDAVP